MKTLLWPFAAGALVFALVLALQRTALPRLTGQSLADAANLTGVAVNIVLLLLAIVSLVIAGQTLSDARQSGEQQQKILEGSRGVLEESRKALQSVVGQLNDQRELLDKTLKTSSEHLTLVQDTVEAERKRLARRPVVEISINTIPDDRLGDVIGVPLNAERWATIPFRVRNVGDLDLQDTVVIVRGTPIGIFVDAFNNHVARPNRSVFQTEPDRPIRRFELVRLATAFDIDVRVPPDAALPFDFELEFHIFGEALATVSRTFRFRANAPVPVAAPTN